MSRSATASTAALALLFGAATLSATPIVIAGAGTKAGIYAFDQVGGNLYSPGSISPTGLGSGSISRTAGQSVSAFAYDYSATGGDVTLAHTFEHHIAAAAPTNTSGNFNNEEDAWTTGTVTFEMGAGDIGYTYAVDGRIDQQGTSRIKMTTSLYDLTLGGGILLDQAELWPSTDAYLHTGETHPLFSGQLSGNLIAGHTYRFDYTALTQHWTIGEGLYDNPYGYTPTDAQGHFNLTLSGPAPVGAVPEPGTLALFGLGVGALALIGRRRK